MPPCWMGQRVAGAARGHQCLRGAAIRQLVLVRTRHTAAGDTRAYDCTGNHSSIHHRNTRTGSHAAAEPGRDHRRFRHLFPRCFTD